MRPVPVDFDLAIASSASGYVARVVESPVGEASAPFGLPLSTDEIRATVDELASAALSRTVASSARLALQSLGRGLFEAIFNGDVYACLWRSLDSAARDGRDLRIRLRLSDVPELIDLPWEFLYFPTRGVYLAADRGTPVVRYLDLADGSQPLLTDLPLHILAVASSPADLLELDVDAERRKLETAVAPLVAAKAVHVAWADDGTFGGLSRALDAGGPHILHFIGHGEWDPGEGSGILQFESGPNDRRSAGVRADTLAAALRGHTSLRLVVLNACEGARTGSRDAFVGVGQALVRAGVPAVVAMQFPITDDAAIRFCGAIYSALGAGEGVDAAVASARHEMLLGQDDIEWATPVLYLRSRDARLFDVGAVPPAPSIPPPVATISTGQVIASNGSFDGVRLDRADHAAPVLRPRPVRLLPADFLGLIGRDADLAAVEGGLANGSFAIYGERGIGKSALLRHVVNRLDGLTDIVRLRGGGRPIEDLGQALFEAFYAETEPALRPSEPQLQHYLSQVSGVVAIDDAAVDREDVEALLDTASACRFFITSETQTLGGAGRSRRLSGLEASAGVDLIAADLGRPLLPAEAEAAAAIVDAVAGSPSRILESIARVREGTSSLEEVRASIASGPEPYSEAARRTKRLLGALGGAPLGVEHITALTGVTASDLAALERHGIIQAQSPRYALTTGATPAHGSPTDPTVYELLPYLARWAESQKSGPSEIVDEAEAIVAALDLGADQGRWGEVARLARAVEDALFVTRRWGLWRTILGHLELAADRVGDDWEAARIYHQLGSRAGALGDLDAGRRYLESAVAIRDANNDADGAALSRHNIGVLDSLILPPQDGGKTDPGPRQPSPGPTPGIRIPFLPIILGVAAILVAGAIVVVAGILPPAPSHVPAPRLEADQTRLEFGDVELGSRTEPRTVVVRNTGDAVAVIAPVSIDPALADFVVDSGCQGELPIDRSCRIEVSFVPGSAGLREADLIVVSEGTGDPPRIRLVGSGRPPPGAPALELGRDLIAFDEVQIGEVSSETIRVISRGETPLRIAAIDDTGRPFEIQTGDCLERDIAREESCTFTVSFTPTDVAPYVGTLTIESNAEGAPHTVTLTGGGAGAARLVVDPTSVDFGAHRRKEQPPSATVTVSNIGNRPTRIGAISIPDMPVVSDAGAVFEVGPEGCAELTVDPGGSCQVVISFNPSLSRPEGDTATLTIPHEAGQALTVPLSGSALVLPELVGEAGAQSYEWSGSAVAVPFSVVVTNDGELPAGIFAIRAWLTPTGGQTAPIPIDKVFDAELRDGNALTTRDLMPGDSLKFGATVSIPIDDFSVDHAFRLEVRIDDCVAPTDQPPTCRIPELDETNNTVFVGDVNVPASPD